MQELSGLVFPTEIVLNYVKNNFELPFHLRLDSLPFAYYNQPHPKLLSDKEITITIPCTIAAQHRDYGSVLLAIKNIKNKLTKRVQLVLLGQPKGDGFKIITAFNTLEDENIKIISFREVIPEEEYKDWLKATDFLILPLKQYAKSHIYKEHLGYSKISGGVNDMIRFGIPALISTHYPLDLVLEKMVQRYSSDQLADAILLWVNQGQYLKYKAEIESILSGYSPVNMQMDFQQKIDRFLK